MTLGQKYSDYKFIVMFAIGIFCIQLLSHSKYTSLLHTCSPSPSHPHSISLSIFCLKLKEKVIADLSERITKNENMVKDIESKMAVSIDN